MKNLIQAAMSTLLAASTAHSQQAVQWKISDGGNGHWYATTPFVGNWPAVRDWCEVRGGHLATITSAAEWTWVKTSLPVSNRFVGGYQDHAAPGYQEPHGGWKWVSGEPFVLEWFMGADDCPGGSPGHCGCGPAGAQDVMFFHGCCEPFRLDDVGDGIISNCDSESRGGVIEWSADCNEDGFVDYGQILLGELPDANNNGVPDSCEVPTCRNADIYRDFNVNGADLGILLSQWGPNTPITESDLNFDGAVDGLDLGILLSFWGPCP